MQWRHRSTQEEKMAKTPSVKPASSKARVALNVQFEQAVNEPSVKDVPAVQAYLFSQGGQLLAQTSLGQKGEAALSFELPPVPAELRLVLAPPGPPDEEVMVDQVLQRGGVEQHLRFDPERPEWRVQWPVFPEVWHCWLRGRCVVRGRVIKRVERDGVAVDRPVCRATVEIYEVDPLRIVIPRLPRDVLAQLRDVVAGRVPWPPGPPVGGLPQPLPDPLPDPLPGPGPLPVIRSAAMQRAEEPVEALHAAVGHEGLRYAALSGSDLVFQRELLANAVLVRPLLCWLHPRLVTMRLIGTAETDACGHFRRVIYKGCSSDQPDLYFKVKQRLFWGVDVTLHAPTPVACHTWWDYPCGSEVTIHVRHPLASTCNPCPPVVAGANWVLFMAIGNHPLSRIRGTGQSLVASTTPDTLGLTDGNAPWGATLRPRLEFDNALRDSLGVHHYRLSWRRVGDVDWIPLHGEVHRHYAHMVADELRLDVFPLGPITVNGQGNLFRIPPAVPPLGQWSQPDVVEDTASGRFDTVAADGTPLLDGKVQLRVELFDVNGQPVDIGALGIRYVVPTSTDLNDTIQTVNAATLGLVSGNHMVITLHINNQPCQASISAPDIAGVAADPCCGVLHYGPGASVHIGWNATHPQGFASYQFGVVRGAQPVISVGGAVQAAPFGTSVTVQHLLNHNLPAGCAEGGCEVAGFSENLSVHAMATNGWSRLSGYDDHDVRAFVLSPP
jgi:hypothetical protein